MGVRLFTYNDPGAPGHPNATRGTMATLLRKCLVTGYSLGAEVTDSAGWEELFGELNNYAVFRALVGSRQLYQVNDNMSDPDVAYLYAGESLAAVDADMVGLWGGDYFGKQYSAAVSGQWYVIADERTCYVLLQSYYGFVLMGFGEFSSIVADDPHNSFLGGHQGASGLPSSDSVIDLHYAYDLGNSNAGIQVHQSATGEVGAAASLLRIGGMSTIGGSIAADLDSIDASLGFYVVPCFIHCDSDNEGGNKIVRGKLRGMYQPLAYRPLANAETYVDAATGKTMICFHIGADDTALGSVVFDLTGPW